MFEWNLVNGVMAVLIATLAIVAWRLYSEAARARREAYIRGYVFSWSLLQKLIAKHPHLELKDCHLVARALREFFLIHLRTKPRFIGMPSRVADDLWHEFILDTRSYEQFCKAAFGEYFHHVPAAATGKSSTDDMALRLTWRFACIEENINVKRPTRLPLLFALDDKLKIVGGFTYSLHRQQKTADTSSDSGCSGGGSSESSPACPGGYACTAGGLIGDSAAASCGGGTSDGGGGSSCGGGGCGGGGGD